MEFIIYSIPFVVAVFLFIFFRKQTVWWEYALLIIASILSALLIEFAMRSSNTTDIEYLGNYVTKIRHYDRWNEYIHRTCTRTVKVGKTTTVQTYDCSYVEDHPERWVYFDARGEEVYIDKEDFEKIKQRFGVEQKFIDMNRHYYTIDGDAQEYVWDGVIEKAKTVTYKHRYENRIKSSRSIFKFEDISKEEADSIGLYDYRDIYELDQTPIMGIKFPKEQEHYIRWINGYYGINKQFRIYMLFFKDKNESIVEKQRSFWQGGNKNELVVCVGYEKDSINGISVRWCNCFSWCDSPVLEVETRNWIMENGLDLKKYAEFISLVIEKKWVRKNFEDFNYVSVELSDTQYIAMLIILGLINIGLSIWIVTNEFENEDERNGSGYYAHTDWRRY